MPSTPLPPSVRPGKQGVRLAGTGLGTPQRLVTNQDLAKIVDTSDEWITQRTGIRERRLLGEGQTIRQVAAEALAMALKNAGLEPGQLDLLLLATLSPQMICPSTAAQVIHDVGAVPAAAMDVNAACSGFVYSLNMAGTLIESGRYRHIAIMGADALSTVTDWSDRRTCVLFGDGAGAAVLSASDDPQQGCLFQNMHSDGSMWTELYCPRSQADLPPNDKIFSGKFNTLQMNGREIYKFAVSTMARCIDEALGACNLKPSDLAVIIPHQSNTRILESARDRLGLPADKVYINIDRFGNTSAASVPICLHELMASGRLKKGDLLLFVALGGGLTWATNLWRL